MENIINSYAALLFSIFKFYSRENEIHGRALERWRMCNNLILLGPHTKACLPIISFLISHPETGLYLHFNYVVALLNDLFGIQVINQSIKVITMKFLQHSKVKAYPHLLRYNINIYLILNL